MPVSIREVASRAGVSVGTVSHVLNGNAAARIAPGTQERVRQIALEMGYRPNRVARSLCRQKTDTIGLLVGGLKNPFFVSVLETMETEALKHGYRILLEVAPSLHGTFGGNIAPPDYWPVDGVLMWGMTEESLASPFSRPYSDLPIIHLGHSRSEPINFVTFDYFRGGALAAQHLIDRHCQRLAYLTPYAFGIDRHAEPRQQGFIQTCQEAGLSPQMILTHAEETRAAGIRAAKEIADLPPEKRPDGLFCHNDMLAIGLCCGLRRAGIRIPDDIAVIGFDGIEEGYYLEAALTTIELPVAEMCFHAVELLCHRIAGKTDHSLGVVLSPTLRPGGTA